MSKKKSLAVADPRAEVEQTLAKAKANVTELAANLANLLQQTDAIKKQIDGESAVIQALQYALSKL